MIELMSEKAVIVHVSVSFVITGTFLRYILDFRKMYYGCHDMTQ